MEVSFELYRVFYHAAKNLNFTLAAEELFVSQSAVSQSIRQLEGQLGVILFKRSGRKLALTEEGKTLYPFVERAYHGIKSGEVALSALMELEAGSVRIGASDTLSKSILLEPLKRFHERYPKIKLSINNRPSSVSVDLLEKHRIDLALVNIDPNRQYPHMRVEKIGEIENGFIATKGYLERYGLHGRVLTLAEIYRHPLIVLEKSATTRRLFDHWVKRHKLDRAPEFEFGSNELIVEMTRLEMGIGFINRMPELGDDPDLVVIPIKETYPKMDIAILTAEDVPLSKAAEAFMKDLVD